MPIYAYRCRTCGHETEDLQKHGDPPPERADDCPSEQRACDLEKVMTTASHRFRPDYSSDGVGGYQRQGEAMVRQVKGRNTTRYGEGSV